MRRPFSSVDLQIGEAIRHLRKSRGLTQSKVAEALGLSFQQIQKYENGDNRVSASLLLEIAKVFGVPVSDLLADLPGRAAAVGDGAADRFPLLGKRQKRLVLALVDELAGKGGD